MLVPTSTGLLQKPVGVSRGSNVSNATKCVLINMILILITAVQKQFFVYWLESNKWLSTVVIQTISATLDADSIIDSSTFTDARF